MHEHILLIQPSRISNRGYLYAFSSYQALRTTVSHCMKWNMVPCNHSVVAMVVAINLELAYPARPAPSWNS